MMRGLLQRMRELLAQGKVAQAHELLAGPGRCGGGGGDDSQVGGRTPLLSSV